MLALALLPLATPAHAGGYWRVSYDYGGTSISSDGFTYNWYRSPYADSSYGVTESWQYRGPGAADGFSGNVSATFTWVPDPRTPGQPPTPLYVKETGSVGTSYSSNSAADDGLGDAATISTTTGYDGNPYVAAYSHGSHLVQKGKQSPVTITHSVSGSTVRGQVSLSYKAEIDSRALSISSSLGQTYHKDSTTGLPAIDQRSNDGTLNLTTIYSFHSFHVVYDPVGNYYNNDAPFINTLTFTPNFIGWDYVAWTDPRTNTASDVPNVVNPDTWKWSPNNSSDYWDTGICQMPYGSIAYQDRVAQGQLSGNQTYSVSYTATDNLDGTTATANANIQLHDEWENLVSADPSTTLHQQRAYAPGRAGVSNNSGAKLTSPPTWTATINASATLGFAFSPSFDVGWAKVLGIAVNASGTVGGSFSISVPGPLLDSGYATYPFVLTTWQTKNYLVDHYTVGGYAGAVQESADDPNSITNTVSWTEQLPIGTPPPS